jgi:hypothetical protein
MDFSTASGIGRPSHYLYEHTPELTQWCSSILRYADTASWRRHAHAKSPEKRRKSPLFPDRESRASNKTKAVLGPNHFPEGLTGKRYVLVAANISMEGAKATTKEMQLSISAGPFRIEGKAMTVRDRTLKFCSGQGSATHLKTLNADPSSSHRGRMLWRAGCTIHISSIAEIHPEWILARQVR